MSHLTKGKALHLTAGTWGQIHKYRKCVAPSKLGSVPIRSAGRCSIHPSSEDATQWATRHLDSTSQHSAWCLFPRHHYYPGQVARCLRVRLSVFSHMLWWPLSCYDGSDLGTSPPCSLSPQTLCTPRRRGVLCANRVSSPSCPGPSHGSPSLRA